MKKKHFITLLSLLLSLSFSQTKPIQGLIKGENDSTLSSVKIISIPSNTKINANKEGEFLFLMPVRDRSLIISHKNHDTDTLDAILFENHTKHNLTKTVAEIDATDSLYLKSLFTETLSMEKANPNIILISKIDENYKRFITPNYSLSNLTLYNLSGSVYGENQNYFRGILATDTDIYLDRVKINNLGNKISYIDYFSIDEINEISITSLGYYNSKVTFGSLNFNPRIKKKYKLIYRHQLINNSYNNNSIFYSLGSKYGRISGTFDKKNSINNYSPNNIGSTSLLNEKQSLNIDFKVKKLFHLRLLGYQSNSSFYNTLYNDNSNTRSENLIAKVINKSKNSNDIINLYSIYQSEISKESLDQLSFESKKDNIGLGFEIEKGFREAVFAFNASSNYVFSIWDSDDVNISATRSISNFSGSFILEREKSSKRFQLKNISLVINREHVKDKPDSMNNSFDYLKNNNWLNVNSSFRIEFLNKVFGEQIIGFYSNGKSYKNPFINDFIINQTISDLASSLPIFQEEKSFFEFGFKNLNKDIFSFFESQFSLKLFQYFIKDKIKNVYIVGSPIYIPINVGDVYINGFDFESKIQSKSKLFFFKTYFSNYKKSDIRAFQFQPDWIFKNKFSFPYKKYNIGLIHRLESGIQLTTMKRSGVFYYDQLEVNNSVDCFISRLIEYKYFNYAFELSFRNILKDTVYIDQFPIYETKYLLSFKLDLF